MSAAAFMRVAKLKVAGIIKTASRHNLREIQAEQGASGPIDATRCHLNQVLEGASTAAGVDQHAKALMTDAGVTTLRKDAVMALELVMSLPVATTVNTQRYFTDCLSWVKRYFACPVLSAVIHLDEAAAHCHILLLPLVDGRMVGNKLIGGRPQLLAMQGSFHETVAFKHGLRKAPARLAGASKRSAAGLVLARLKETGDSALTSDVWSSIRGCIESGPERFLEALGLVAETKVKAPKTMAQIFTSPGKGPKREVTQPSNAIAFDQPVKSEKTIVFKSIENRVKGDQSNAIAFVKPAQEKHERYDSVAFAKTPTLSPPTKGTRQPAWHGIYCSHRVKPIGLFTRLIPGSGFQIDSDGVISGLRDQPGQSVAESSTTVAATETASSVDDSDLNHRCGHQDVGGETRLRDDALDAGAWDSDRGEFATAQHSTGKTPPPAARHTVDTNVQMHTKKRTEAYPRALAIELVSGDSHVERDDFYQPDFSESEVHSWLH